MFLNLRQRFGVCQQILKFNYWRGGIHDNPFISWDVLLGICTCYERRIPLCLPGRALPDVWCPLKTQTFGIFYAVPKAHWKKQKNMLQWNHPKSLLSKFEPDRRQQVEKSSLLVWNYLSAIISTITSIYSKYRWRKFRNMYLDFGVSQFTHLLYFFPKKQTNIIVWNFYRTFFVTRRKISGNFKKKR